MGNDGQIPDHDRICLYRHVRSSECSNVIDFHTYTKLLLNLAYMTLTTHTILPSELPETHGPSSPTGPTVYAIWMD